MQAAPSFGFASSLGGGQRQVSQGRSQESIKQAAPEANNIVCEQLPKLEVPAVEKPLV